MGGGSWSVYGLQDQGFSNDVRESAGSFRVKLYGYNYDELSYWTEQLKEKLLLHRRIKEVTVSRRSLLILSFLGGKMIIASSIWIWTG